MTSDTVKDTDLVFREEREAWAAVKWHLPGQVGHDPTAWTRWLQCSTSANELLRPSEYGVSDAPSVGNSFAPAHADLARLHDAFTVLVFEIETELSTSKAALDALHDDGLPMSGATGRALKRSLEAIERALGDAVKSFRQSSPEGADEQPENTNRGV